MIPDNPHLHDASDGVLVAPFKFPDNISTDSELEDYELGGIALQDPSKGLEYQIWKAHYDPVDSTVYVTPTDTGVPIPLFTEPDVVELAITFDQNMRWSSATRTSDNVMRHRWYDTAIEAYTTTSYNGVTSVRLAMDDKRLNQIQFGVSDIVITYLSSGILHWAIQRDRFINIYTFPGKTFSSKSRITHFGLSEKLRLQWRIGKRRIT